MNLASPLACVIHGPGDIRVEEVAAAPLGPNDAEVSVAVGGICGSDISYFMKGAVGRFELREPMILGHEVVGMVTAVGSAASSALLGRRVAVDPSFTCGTCGPCRAGRENACENVRFLGSAARFPHVQGAFSQRLVVDTAQLLPLDDHLPFETAAFAEPLAVAIHAIRRTGQVEDKHVAVIGAGPIGLLATLVLRHRGCEQVTVADIKPGPLRHALVVGATDTVDLSLAGAEIRPAAIVIEASGSPAGLATALRTVARGGRVVQVGLLPAVAESVPLDLIATREIDVHGSFRFTHAEFAESVSMLAEGLAVAPLVTGRFDLADAGAAFAQAVDRTAAVKVQLVLNDGVGVSPLMARPKQVDT
jgi:L-idonate 5-dehydrogenase